MEVKPRQCLGISGNMFSNLKVWDNLCTYCLTLMCGILLRVVYFSFGRVTLVRVLALESVSARGNFLVRKFSKFCLGAVF